MLSIYVEFVDTCLSFSLADRFLPNDDECVGRFHDSAELARGGELFDLLVENGPPDEAHTATLMKSLLEAVAFVHLHGIIHGDIKVRGRGWGKRGGDKYASFFAVLGVM